MVAASFASSTIAVEPASEPPEPLIASPTSPVAAAAVFSPATAAGRLRNRRIGESSGLAASTRRDGVFFTVNDSGGGAALYALNAAGDDLGAVQLADVANRDWEDLAAFRRDGASLLAIADTGDNAANRATSRIVIVPEPEPGDDGRYAGDLAGARSIEFRYEDGPKDVEAMAVDDHGERIYLLTKRLVPAVLYCLETDGAVEASSGIRVARRVSVVDTVPPPTPQDLIGDPVLGSYAAQPTAMDFSSDGAFAVVLTYKAVYLYDRGAGESWATAFSRVPRTLPLPEIVQAESAAIGADAIYVTSERVHAPILRFARLPDRH